MGINIFWDEQHNNMIHLVIDGGWTWDEFYEAMKTIHHQMDESSQDKIQFIVDMRDGQTLPRDVLSRMRKFTNHSHPKSDKMAVVSAGTFAKLLFDIMENLLPERMKRISLVDSIEQAYDVLLDEQIQVGD